MRYVLSPVCSPREAARCKLPFALHPGISQEDVGAVTVSFVASYVISFTRSFVTILTTIDR